MKLVLLVAATLAIAVAVVPTSAAKPDIPGCDTLSTCGEGLCVYGQPGCYGLYCEEHGTENERCTPYPCQYCVPWEPL